MNILEKIKVDKEAEVSHKQQHHSISKLKTSPHYQRTPRLLSKEAAEDRHAFLIAEFKRKSPSKGIIRQGASPAAISKAYENAGANALSVLTDVRHFGALENDFLTVRSQTSLPMLRKDFIIAPYQVHETKAIGADIMLLIAAILHPEETAELASLGRELGMDILLELHDESEMGHINEYITLVGINNRDLKTFQVDLSRSIAIKSALPQHIPTIAESGLSHPDDIKILLKAGFDGFLVGESFMKSDDPGQTCRDFIDTIKEEQNAD